MAVIARLAKQSISEFKAAQRSMKAKRELAKLRTIDHRLGEAASALLLLDLEIEVCVCLRAVRLLGAKS